MKDEWSADSLARSLGASAARYRPYAFDCIDSTNAEAKRLAVSGERFALIAAAEQSAGRGRMGRRFHSPVGTGVYFSLLHTLDRPISDAVSVTSATAVAVMRAIRRLCGVQTEIKWVNDLYLDGKKVAGILAESVSNPARPTECAVIIGIGINLRPASFPAELAEIATTLGNSTVSRSALIAAIAEELTPYLCAPDLRTWLDDYRAHSCVLGRAVEWRIGEEIFCGRAVEIDCDGALIVERADGARARLATGEISLRPIVS